MNTKILLLFCFLLCASLGFAQFPSFKSTNYDISPLDKEAELDELDSVKIDSHIKFYIADLNEFLKKEIHEKIKFDSLQLLSNQEYLDVIKETDPSISFDDAQQKIYNTIKSNVDVDPSDDNLAVVKSTDFKNDKVENFINTHFLAEYLEINSANFALISKSYEEVQKEVKKMNKSFDSYMETGNIIAAERLKIKIKKQTKRKETLQTIYEDLRDNSTNINYYLFGTNQPDAVSAVYSKNKSELYLINESALQFNGNGAVVNTEFASTFFGPLKVNFGTVISNDSDPDDMEEDAMTPSLVDEKMVSEESIQRLITGGGNTYLGLELPVVFHSSQRITFFSYLRSRASLELDEFSDDVNTTTGVFSFSSHALLAVNSDDKAFNFYLQASYGLYGGASGFRERLGVDKKVFDFGTISTGVTINNVVRIAVTFKPFSSQNQLSTGRALLGIQILPDAF
ncbi:MAG: hypothetical protein ACSHWW_08770 [Nonlabens sp.]|uniref:hypothetical protein n=1 Tax=Nonlabens sp. TaxID=1888209 RepID=UPI003EFAEA2C